MLLRSHIQNYEYYQVFIIKQSVQTSTQLPLKLIIIIITTTVEAITHQAKMAFINIVAPQKITIMIERSKSLFIMKGLIAEM